MNKKPLLRKLAVILHADVVESTKLVQRDETLAHERMRDAFRRFADLIDEYGGRAHEVRGDALVAEFERASDAIAAALAFQDRNAALNAALGDDMRPVLRIGISLGEVIIADGTLTGTGVVLAQRLEQLAEPGGVVAQAAAADTVPTRMPFDFDSLGEVSLKGFDQPVKAYAIRLKAGECLPLTERARDAPDPEPAAPRRAQKPSIAVLPFANMSNDPEQEYFADGISEDLITALAHLKQWHVIARNSSFAYKGRHVDIREIGRQLGVGYVLEGSVRKAGSKLRITGQLIEAESGSHLWADRYDGDLEDVFELQDKITTSVVGAIEPSLRRAEIARSKRKPTTDIDAYDLYLQALPHLFSIRPEPNEQALGLLHRAIELDPDYALALAHLAWGYEERVTRVWGDYGQDDTGTAIALARRAISLDRDDVSVLAVAGFVLVMLARDHTQGLEAVMRARELNPNIAFVSGLIGAVLNICGSPEEGLVCIEDAIRVSPGDPGAFIFHAAAAMAHLMCGRPAEAYEQSSKAARIYADWDTTYRVMAPALVELGRIDEARAAVARLLELAPGMTVSRLRERWPMRDKQALNRFLDGLRAAGLPE